VVIIVTAVYNEMDTPWVVCGRSDRRGSLDPDDWTTRNIRDS